MIKSGEYMVVHKTVFHVKVKNPMLSDTFDAMLNESVQVLDINKRLDFAGNVEVLKKLHDGSVQSIEEWKE